MADYIGEFNSGSGAADATKRQRDFDDLQLELSGAETGRIPRFLSPEARESMLERNSGKGSKPAISTLDLLLLSDREYAQVYERAMDALIEAETVVQNALDRAIAGAEETQRALDDIRDKSMKLPDGSAVFMDQHGYVRDENGTVVDPTLSETLEWQGYEPSYEVFDTARDADNEADAKVIAIREDQAELGDIRQEMRDQDNPPSTERVNDLHKRIDEIKSANEITTPVAEQTVDQSLAVAKFEF